MPPNLKLVTTFHIVYLSDSVSVDIWALTIKTVLLSALHIQPYIVRLDSPTLSPFMFAFLKPQLCSDIYKFHFTPVDDLKATTSL